MTTKRKPMRSLLYAVAMSSFASTVLSADSTSTTSETAKPLVDCSAAIKTPEEATDEVKAVYQQIRAQCAQLALRDVSTQLSSAKTNDIAQALSAFGSLKGQTGTLTNADKANHIAEWFAKRALFEASMKAGTALKGVTVSAPSLVVITDPNISARNAELRVAIARLMKHSDAMASAAARGNSLIKGTTAPAGAPPSEARIGIVPLLTLVPSAISAAQSVASIFKSTTTLNGLTLTADPAVMVAGLAMCVDSGLNAKLRLPAFSSSPNEFLELYDQVQNVADGARQVLANLTPLAAHATDKKTPSAATLTVGKEELEGAIKVFEEYDKRLHTSPQAAQDTPYETLVATAAMLGPAPRSLLMFNAVHLGANTGTSTRSFSSDQFEYATTVLVTYAVVNENGQVVKSGVVSGGAASRMKVAEMGERIAAAYAPKCGP